MRRGALLGLVALTLLAAALFALLAGGTEPASAQSTPRANADGTYTVPRDWPLPPLGDRTRRQVPAAVHHGRRFWR